MKRMVFNIRLKLLLILISFGFLMIAACSNNQTTSTEENTGEGVENDEDTFTFVAAIAYGDVKEGGPGYASINMFYDEVEKRSEGRVKFERHYNNALIPQDQMLEALKAGTVDFITTAPQYYTSVAPSGNLGNMYFWAESREQAYEIITQTEVGEIYDQEFLDQGAKILVHGFSNNNAMMTTFPVNGVADLKGHVFRSQAGMDQLWFDEIGLTATQIPYAEIYEALQRGIAEGIMTSTSGIITNKWYEVLDYLILPFLSEYPLNFTAVNPQTWEKLPNDIQDLMIEVAKETELATVEDGNKTNSEIETIAKEYGMEVIKLSEEEFNKIAKSYNVVFEEFASLSENNVRIMEIIKEKNSLLK